MDLVRVTLKVAIVAGGVLPKASLTNASPPGTKAIMDYGMISV
jgi:hypothetical protein